MSEHTERCCDSASTDLGSVCRSGPGMRLEEDKVKSEAKRELKEKKKKKGVSNNVLESEEIRYPESQQAI